MLGAKVLVYPTPLFVGLILQRTFDVFSLDSCLLPAQGTPTMTPMLKVMPSKLSLWLEW